MSSAPPSTTLQRVPPVIEGDTDTMLSASRINDLAKAIRAFTNIKGGRNVKSIVQRGFRWKDLEPDSTRTCFSKEVRDELFAAVNGLSRTTGNPPFRFIVANGNVNLVAGDGKGGTPLVEPPKDGEHLLEAHVTNRLIDAVNRAWDCTANGAQDSLGYPLAWIDINNNAWRAGVSDNDVALVKAEDGWLIDFAVSESDENEDVKSGWCVYDPSYNKVSIPQWEVIGGTLDLIGKREPDGPEVDNFLPNTQMYWDLIGTAYPANGTLQCKNNLFLQAGHSYQLSCYIAGSQREPFNLGAYVKLGTLSGGVATGSHVNEFVQPISASSFWEQHFFDFTAPESATVKINFSSNGIPSSTIGPLLDNVYLKDTTNNTILLFDDFNGRYRCRTGLPWDFPYFIP